RRSSDLRKRWRRPRSSADCPRYTIMTSTIRVEIVSAERELWSGEGQMVFAPALMGEVGIAPNHSQMLSPIKAGDVRVLKEDGDEEAFYVSGGLMEVQPNLVTILSRSEEHTSELQSRENLVCRL